MHWILALVLAAGTEHHHEEEESQLDIPHQRLASGTSWQPDDTPARMIHLMAGGWTVMLHGAATLGWDC